MIKYLAILTLFALAAAYSEENGVLKLAESDFPQVLADHPYLFIKFYTPWCHHCKKIAPIFIELGQALADTNSESSDLEN
jgi:thiol-disulfide isomerase/thioredoxin